MIIVTGGAGFIGSCLVRELNRLGKDDIIVVDHLTTSEKWKNLQHKRIEDYLDRADFLERIQSRRLEPSSIEAIFHLGACSSTTETDSHYLMYNNYRYSKELAGFAFENGIRFIYASSAATYGAGEFGYSDDVEMLTRLHPLNMYGYSKQCFDEWIVKNQFHRRAVGLKFFNVFGETLPQTRQRTKVP